MRAAVGGRAAGWLEKDHAPFARGQASVWGQQALWAVLAAGTGAFATADPRTGRLPEWNQVSFTVADQIGVAHAAERLA